MVIILAGFVGWFLLDPPWAWVVLFGALAVEVLETYGWIRFLRRYRIRTGPEAMLGEAAEVIDECRPRGRVKRHGESWRAECPAGADPGERVRITAVRGLTLIVEPEAGVEDDNP